MNAANVREFIGKPSTSINASMRMVPNAIFPKRSIDKQLPLVEVPALGVRLELVSGCIVSIRLEKRPNTLAFGRLGTWASEKIDWLDAAFIHNNSAGARRS